MNRRRFLAPFEQKVYRQAFGSLKSCQDNQPRQDIQRIFLCIAKVGWVEGSHVVRSKVKAIVWNPVIDCAIEYDQHRFIHSAPYAHRLYLCYAASKYGSNKILVRTRKDCTSVLNIKTCMSNAAPGGHIRTMILLRRWVKPYDQKVIEKSLKEYYFEAIRTHKLEIMKLISRWLGRICTVHTINYAHALRVATNAATVKSRRVLRLIVSHCTKLDLDAVIKRLDPVHDRCTLKFLSKRAIAMRDDFDEVS